MSVKRAAVLVPAFLLLASCASKPTEPVVDRDMIRKVVFSNFRGVQKCYMDTIDRRPGAEGKLVAGWTIMPDGKTAEAKVISADRKLAGIDDCIVTEIGKWVFPKTPGGQPIDVTYPFFFAENGRFGDTE